MIYIGFFQFNDKIDYGNHLSSVLSSFTGNSSRITRKNSLSLCYGKVSDKHDLDDIWENNDSLLIGRIFNKSTENSFNKEEYKNLSHLDKESLLKKFWGKYVYFHTKESNSEFEVILDTTGQLPFFYRRFSNGNVLFSSSIELLYKFLDQKPEINWSYLCSYVIYGNSSSTETPFKNIYELPPTFRLEITKENITTIPFWNPLSSYKTTKVQEKNAVTPLRATLKSWVEPYQNIYVSLSGGLDSSSLVYCLKELVRKDQNLKAVNYFHSQIKSSNELVHARKVCQETGIDLIEMDVSDSLPFDMSLKTHGLKPNKPFPGLVCKSWTEKIFDCISSQENFTFISGHGSDHIFLRPPTKKCVLDYLFERGTKGFKKKLEEVAQYYRDPLFSVLKANASSLFSYLTSQSRQKRNLKKAVNELPPWVTQNVRQNISAHFVHPIYAYLPPQILPGKYDQIDGFYEGLASIHMETMNLNDPTFYPFLYHPVVHFALSLPTYALFEKGYDRYPLRKAVGTQFKTETVWRRDKSQTTGIFQLGVKKNLDYIRELCLEGAFVKQGFVEKEGFSKTISLIANGDIQFMWPFTHIASVEMFLREWGEIS